MAATIRLTVLTGPHKGNRYCFRESGGKILGRAPECDICICGQSRDLNISRRHCQLTFDPPSVCVDDLGSTNGTYVNGHRCAALTQDASVLEDWPVIAAKDGDILQIGGTTLQIHVMDCPGWDEADPIKKNCPAKC